MYFLHLSHTGCRRLAYPAIVAGGKNGLCLHYHQNNHLLQAGELVHECFFYFFRILVTSSCFSCNYLINFDFYLAYDVQVLVDVGGEYRHYAADITRTFPVGGKFSPAQRDFYEAVLAVQVLFSFFFICFFF
jgi:hypothetical protein